MSDGYTAHSDRQYPVIKAIEGASESSAQTLQEILVALGRGGGNGGMNLPPASGGGGGWKNPVGYPVGTASPVPGVNASGGSSGSAPASTSAPGGGVNPAAAGPAQSNQTEASREAAASLRKRNRRRRSHGRSKIRKLRGGSGGGRGFGGGLGRVLGGAGGLGRAGLALGAAEIGFSLMNWGPTGSHSATAVSDYLNNTANERSRLNVRNIVDQSFYAAQNKIEKFVGSGFGDH